MTQIPTDSVTPPEPTEEHDHDPRFTPGLFAEISAALDCRGYVMPTQRAARNVAYARSLEALRHLVRVYEGGEAK